MNSRACFTAVTCDRVAAAVHSGAAPIGATLWMFTVAVLTATFALNI